MFSLFYACFCLRVTNYSCHTSSLKCCIKYLMLFFFELKYIFLIPDYPEFIKYNFCNLVLTLVYYDCYELYLLYFEGILYCVWTTFLILHVPLLLRMAFIERFQDVFFLLHRIFGLHNVLKDNKAYSPRLSRVLSSKTGFPLVRYRDQNSEVICLQYKTGMKAKLMIMVFNSLIIRCSHGNYSIDIIRWKWQCYVTEIDLIIMTLDIPLRQMF